MNPYTAVATMLALSLFWNQPAQISWEKRAVDDTRRIIASELDTELPRVSFAEWFGKTVKQPDDAIVWQLTECGEAAPNGARDLKACVEANTILADGRRVILRVAVGTFKQGMTGPLAFQFGVIEVKNELRQIRRLRDLQLLLLNPDKVPYRLAPKLPDLSINGNQLMPNRGYVPVPPALGGDDAPQPAPIEDSAPPPPKPPERSSQEGLRQGAPIKKLQPTYPRNNSAKRFNASGDVQVEVTIGITGRVTMARAVKGHPLLRDAAVAAARQWEFEPTTINGVPTETQIVLTFSFTVPPE